MPNYQVEYYALTEIDYDGYKQAILRVLGPWYWQGGDKNDEWAAKSILKLFRLPAGSKAGNVKGLASHIRTDFKTYGSRLHDYLPPIIKLLFEIKEHGKIAKCDADSLAEPDLFGFAAPEDSRARQEGAL